MPHLLTLPLEIRLEIYLFKFYYLDIRTIAPHPETQLAVGIPGRPLDVQLLRTCRQIHDEASPILYGSKRFLFYTDGASIGGYESAVQWLRRIGPMNRSLLRRLEVNFSYAVNEMIEDGSDSLEHWVRAKFAAEEAGYVELAAAYERMREDVEERHRLYVLQSVRFFAAECRNLQELGITFHGASSNAFRSEEDDDFDEDSNRARWFRFGLFNRDAELRDALRQIVGLKTLRIGYTADLQLVEDIAVAMGVRKVEVDWQESDVAEFLGTWGNASAGGWKKGVDRKASAGWVFDTSNPDYPTASKALRA